MTVRLFVGNLPYDVTEPELRVYFAAIGPLASLALPLDRDTGTPRGFAFVEFQERTDAEEAIRRLNAQAFKGRPLAVSEARARGAQAPPRAARPGGPTPPGRGGPRPRREPRRSVPTRRHGAGGPWGSGPRPPSGVRSAPYTSARGARCLSGQETRRGTTRRGTAPRGGGTAPTPSTSTTPRRASASG